MVEPWQVRERQQNQFIGKLADEVFDAAEESGNDTSFIIRFCNMLLAHINIAAGGEPIPCQHEADRLFGKVLAEILAFQKVKSETLFLLGLLLKKLSDSIYSFTLEDYQADRIANPKKVYGQKK